MKTEKKVVPEQTVTEKNLMAHAVIWFAIAIAIGTPLLLFVNMHQKLNGAAENGSDPSVVQTVKDSGHEVGNGRIISADAGYVMPERTASDLRKAGFGTNFHQLEIASTNATAVPQRTAGK